MVQVCSISLKRWHFLPLECRCITEDTSAEVEAEELLVAMLRVKGANAKQVPRDTDLEERKRTRDTVSLEYQALLPHRCVSMKCHIEKEENC